MQYYQRAQLCYSQGWAFATWLKNVTKDERYAKIPELLFTEMQKGFLERRSGSPFPGFGGGGGGDVEDPVIQKAYETVFGGLDLDEMDAAFKADLKKKM